jgi:hypothetical protein
LETKEFRLRTKLKNCTTSGRKCMMLDTIHISNKRQTILIFATAGQGCWKEKVRRYSQTKWKRFNRSSTSQGKYRKFQPSRQVLLLQKQEKKQPYYVNIYWYEAMVTTYDWLAPAYIEITACNYSTWNWTLCDEYKTSKQKSNPVYFVSTIPFVDTIINWRNRQSRIRHQIHHHLHPSQLFRESKRAVIL